MLYNFALFVALAVFAAGLIYKISGWFRFNMDLPTLQNSTPWTPRIRSALKGILGVLFSIKLAKIIKVLVKDILLQLHILREDFLRWLMHMLIFYGFMFLFFTHALDKIIVTSIFDKYYLTINPFLVASGMMILTGIAISLVRRFILKIARLKTTSKDYYALIILASIVISGLAMELTKITSYLHYQKYWYIHILATFIGLALVPCTKMFHMFTTPMSLLANAVMDRNSEQANIQTRQIMELDACMSCGTCSNRCSVAAACDSIGNELILPSERMAFLKQYFADKHIGTKGLIAIQQGIYLCTNCDRCTVACPAGINLRDLWFNVREEFIFKMAATPLMLTPFSYYRGLQRHRLNPEVYNKPVIAAEKKITSNYKLIDLTDNTIALTSKDRGTGIPDGISDGAGTYSFCFACENCSTVCPVVGNFDDPQKNLDLLPHQIMRALVFGIQDLARGSRMIWYCLTCYQCQEHCPQGVKVTDILYELKAISAKEVNPA